MSRNRTDWPSAKIFKNVHDFHAIGLSMHNGRLKADRDGRLWHERRDAENILIEFMFKRKQIRVLSKSRKYTKAVGQV